jgi:hypothetical protein
MFTFPENARSNADRQAVEFDVGIREYEDIVRVSRQAFRHPAAIWVAVCS